MQISWGDVGRSAKLQDFFAKSWGDSANGLEDSGKLHGESLRDLSFVWGGVWASFCKEVVAAWAILLGIIQCLPGASGLCAGLPVFVLLTASFLF